MAGDAAHLGDDHAQVPGLFGEFELHQLFDGQGPAEIHVHAGQIVHPVGVGNPLPRREVLADLFGAAMQIADVRRDFRNDLAVGPQHQPQHAVRAGMLRAHVDEHLVGANVEFDDPRIVDICRHVSCQLSVVRCQWLDVVVASLPETKTAIQYRSTANFECWIDWDRFSADCSIPADHQARDRSNANMHSIVAISHREFP